MLIGYDDHLYTALTHGADGTIGIGYNVLGDLHVKIYDEFRKGNYKTSERLCYQSVDFTNLIT